MTAPAILDTTAGCSADHVNLAVAVNTGRPFVGLAIRCGMPVGEPDPAAWAERRAADYLKAFGAEAAQ